MAKLLGREGNKATIEFTIGNDEYKKAIDVVYKKTKGRYSVPGFRKGKAPRKMIENMYGEGVFYEDALNEVLPKAYDVAVEELGIDVVSQPDLDIKEFEKDSDILIEAKVDLMPVVELPEYDDLECKVYMPEFTEEAFDQEIERQREMNSRLVPAEGKKAELGDTVIIDFVGKIDGKEFEGGSAENHTLELGSGAFIQGFEDQVVGKEVGEEFDVNISFPEDYAKDDLAGKPAVFTVKIQEHKVKEMPEVDDDFAMDISDFDTLEEYKADYLEKAKKAYDDRLEVEKENAAIKALTDITVIDIPESMIDSEVDSSLRDIDYRFRNDGFSLDQYLEMTGMDIAGIKDQLRDNAEASVKHKLVLGALVDKLSPEVSEEEIDEEIKKAVEYGSGSYEEIKKFYDKNGYEPIENHIKSRKALAELLTKVDLEVLEPVKEEEVFDPEAFEAAVEEAVSEEENTEE